MEASSFKSLKIVSKENVDRKRRGAEMLRASAWKARCGKQINSTLSTREQGEAAKWGRRGDSVVCFSLFSPKNTSYDFHRSGWWNESVTLTRSPFSKYNHRFSKSGLLSLLVPLPDKLLLNPQDPPPLWGLPGLPQVEPMALSPLFPRPSSTFSKDILSSGYVLSPPVKWEFPGLKARPCSLPHPQCLVNAY